MLIIDTLGYWLDDILGHMSQPCSPKYHPINRIWIFQTGESRHPTCEWVAGTLWPTDPFLHLCLIPSASLRSASFWIQAGDCNAAVTCSILLSLQGTYLIVTREWQLFPRPADLPCRKATEVADIDCACRTIQEWQKPSHLISFLPLHRVSAKLASTKGHLINCVGFCWPRLAGGWNLKTVLSPADLSAQRRSIRAQWDQLFHLWWERAVGVLLNTSKDTDATWSDWTWLPGFFLP